MSERYEVMRQFTRGFGAAITLSEGCDEANGQHFMAGYEAGYPLRKAKNEALDRYLVSTGREPQAVIVAQHADAEPGKAQAKFREWLADEMYGKFWSQEGLDQIAAKAAEIFNGGTDAND